MDVKETILMVLGTVQREGMQEFIAHLNSTDYFTSPASTKYHGSVVGGLAKHSLDVYKAFHRKCKEYAIVIPEDSIAIAALLHDYCKVGSYKLVQKWKKDESTGNQWEQYEVYDYAEDTAPWGHGEKSVIELQKWFKLTDQEIALIRWHMGGFEPVENRKYFNSAVKLFPEITLMHAADLEVTHLLDGR